MNYRGLLYSQIGYDLDNPKRAIIRGSSKDEYHNAVYSVFCCETGNTVLEGKPVYWGEKWHSHWWVIDFSVLDCPGSYVIFVSQDNEGEKREELFRSSAIKIDEALLWKETAVAVGIESFESRLQYTRNNNGWMDCGLYLREACSHALALIGLAEFLEYGFFWLTETEIQRLSSQILRGCRYLVLCQDHAERLGEKPGAMVHEIPSQMLVLPQDSMLSAVALGHSARILAERFPEDARNFLNHAESAYLYATRLAEVPCTDGFSTVNHGAPASYEMPHEWMTRELVLQLQGCMELIINGRLEYKTDAVNLARQIMDRQIPESKAEDGLYGHFYEYSDAIFSEKANIHHHVGRDTGGILPHYILGFIELAARFYDHPNAPEWEFAIRNFAYGYFLPACRQNPFYILPEGYFSGEGLLYFCGPWHGMNATLAFAALLASKLENKYHDVSFRDIAVGNLLWITGLNTGITKDSFNGFGLWKADIPEGKARPYSLICGIGTNHVKGWIGIRGSVLNGFSANPQFKLEVPPTLKNDVPSHFTDEDWIPHAAAYVGAMANMRMWRRLFPEFRK